ncbi:MAG TPA: histidine kinase N-terminal 7TM domain-containing protein [Kineosporiaceae bacterium]|nr:histidine kinase N-terminal 7TM domain-containing protein [Kineosporiaceae bacterium]
MSESVGLGVGLGVGAAAYLGLACYVWLHRRATGGRALVVILLSVFVWSLCYGFELGSHTVAAARVWSGLKFLGIVGLAPAFWAFVMAYTGRARQVSGWVLALLAVEPVTVLTLLSIPATGGLVHDYTPAQQAAIRLDRAPVAAAGPLFWPHAIYTYAVIVFSAGMLITRLVQVTRTYRRQAAALSVAVMIPLAGNAIYNLNPGSTAEVDPTPFLFAVTAVILVWGFFRLRLLDLVPVARGQVVEQMVDAVLVLDLYGRVVDANPAGMALLGARRGEIVGRDAAGLLPLAGVLLERHTPGGTTRGDMSLRARPGGGSRDLALSLTSLRDRFGEEAGRLLVVSEVTERMETQRRLTELLAEQTRVSEILQTSLRPATLPEVPGLRLAARSVPAQEGARVGGDFYDVHPSVGGDWAFVIGDVSGKGVRAAVVTSMARYGARTLSAQGWPPDQLLQQLNDALLDPEDPERFCTVLYGRVTPLRAGDGGSLGVRIRLASGGHPPPLIRRRDGTVSSARCSGTALGLLAAIRVGQAVVDLAPGDLLLAYTDGVTEARRGLEQFGEERLAQVLAAAQWEEAPGPAAADKVAHAVADRVVGTVVGAADHRDDIAVLVLAAI